MIRKEPISRNTGANRDPEVVAFAWFAQAHPHAAAELDWPKFAAFVRSVNSTVTDEDIRQALRETDMPQERG